MTAKKKTETPAEELVQQQILGVPEAPGDEAQKEQETPAKELGQTVSAYLLTNVKHNDSHYSAGSTVNLPEDLFRRLQASKAVRRAGE